MSEGCNASPYMGTEPFAFATFSGKDRSEAFTLIEKLASEGYRIFFAQAEPSSAQRMEETACQLSERLSSCAALIALYSSEAADDHHFRKMVTAAVLSGKPVLPVFLEDVELSCGMRLQCGDSARTNWYAMTDELAQLQEQPVMQSIRGTPDPAIRIEMRKPTIRSGAPQQENANRPWAISAILVDEDGLLRQRRPEEQPTDGLKNAEQASARQHPPSAAGPVRTMLVEEEDAVGREGGAPGPRRGAHGTLIIDEIPPVCVLLATGERWVGRCGVTKIGRDPSCDICIPEETVSSRHLELLSVCHASDAFKNTIRDCRSSNGSWVDGERLERGASVSVGDQARVSLGRNVRLFIAFGKAAQALAANHTLACLECAETGERAVIGQKVMLGRNDPFRNGFFDDMRISWEHAQLWCENGEYLIQDRSSNGTCINGTQMEKYSTASLRDGTEIGMGCRRYIFRLIALKETQTVQERTD